MSGIIGHATYAMLAARTAAERGLPVAPVIYSHFASYLAGSYVGCDVQTMPAAICVDTGKGVGHGPSPIEKSPITGGEVRPWKFVFEEKEYAPRELHETFYGRAHLILGWSQGDVELQVPLSQLVDYAAAVTGDTIELFGPNDRPLAYVLGWLTHVIGDGLIKSVLRGLDLNLLDGKYTAMNRPVQDLVSFNEVGIGELGVDWAALLDDLATTPVEPVQLHYMRCAEKQGRLGAHFPDGWVPGQETLLRALLAENRRYQRERNVRLVEQLTVRDGTCDAELSRIAGGLGYDEMLEAAKAARFREALDHVGELIADFFEKVIEEQDRLEDLPDEEIPSWETLTKRWRAAE